MMDLFDTKNIKPMLIAENVKPFEDSDFIYELKWDGERCVAYLDPKGGTELRNKRNVKMLPKAPELTDICKQAKTRCILDGELLCIVDGKPSFEAIQRRSVMSNYFKISLESKRTPATFVAFDCLYYNGQDLTMKPLSERQDYLYKAVSESPRLAISRTFTHEQVMSLFTLAQEQGLEGIVGKRKDSLYFQGKNTKDWKKIKNLLDDDYVVCGWIPKSNHMTGIVLGQYNNGVLVYKGHVTLGVSGDSFSIIKEQPQVNNPPFPVPQGHDNEHARWLEPTLVCVVQFMYKTKSGSLRQPVFKGLRNDKAPKECIKNSSIAIDYAQSKM